MGNYTDYCMVISTAGSAEEAKKIAEVIVSEKLAACVQIQEIESFYMWKGEACAEKERLLMIKTRSNLYKKLELLIKKIHSYETPEIIKVPIIDGSLEYLQWIDGVTLDE